jgi:protein CWC15
MTTAHRPTFFPAKGGSGKNEGDLAKLSKQYSARDMPSHKTLKYRQDPQEHEDEPRTKSLRRKLEERETRSTTDGHKSSSTVLALPEPKRPRHEDEPDADVDDPLEETNDADLESGDESEDEEALMAELAAIKKERAAERAEKEAREKAEQDRIRREDLLHANPLLQAPAPSNFTVKRRWDSDVVFKNCAKGTDDKKQPNFINDSIRSDFHRKFMEKYIK